MSPLPPPRPFLRWHQRRSCRRICPELLRLPSWRLRSARRCRRFPAHRFRPALLRCSSRRHARARSPCRFRSCCSRSCVLTWLRLRCRHCARMETPLRPRLWSRFLSGCDFGSPAKVSTFAASLLFPVFRSCRPTCRVRLSLRRPPVLTQLLPCYPRTGWNAISSRCRTWVLLTIGAAPPTLSTTMSLASRWCLRLLTTSSPFAMAPCRRRGWFLTLSPVSLSLSTGRLVCPTARASVRCGSASLGRSRGRSACLSTTFGRSRRSQSALGSQRTLGLSAAPTRLSTWISFASSSRSWPRRFSSL